MRATLEPITPDDRPAALTAAAIVAALLALANLGLVIGGYEVRDGAGGPGGGILFAVILLVTAWGMWQARYWAVLGFQALLALTALFGFLSLTVAASVWAALFSVAITGGAGFLFYKLIRVLARIQLPDRPTRRGLE